MKQPSSSQNTSVVLFVCRGNALRGIMAEALLRSKRLPGITVKSAGTVATQYKSRNSGTFLDVQDILARHGVSEFVKDHYGDQLTQKLLDDTDLVIFLNDIVRQEAAAIKLTLPLHVQTWDIVDVGETGRTPETESERLQCEEDIFAEINEHLNKFIISTIKGTTLIDS